MKYGKPKSLDEITLDDVLKNPIWSPVWSIGLESEYPEDFQAPLLNETDLDEEIDNPVITLKVEGTNLIASGEFDWSEEKLISIAVWYQDSWVLIRDVGLTAPVILMSIPTIQGQANIRFECLDLIQEEAKIIG